MKMQLRDVVTLTLLSVALNIEFSECQGTNLLQRYIKQYFSEYFPAKTRSYTLYGNGQNGPADFHGGLPFAYETQGKVNSLIYSTSADPPLSPPSRASAKNTEGIIKNAWNFGGGPHQNSFYPNAQYPVYSSPTQYSRSGDVGQLPPSAPLPAPPPEEEAGEEVQSRMGNVEDASMTAAISSNVQIGENGNAEIPMQTSMNF